MTDSAMSARQADATVQANMAILAFMGSQVPQDQIPGKLDALWEAYQLDNLPRPSWSRLEQLLGPLFSDADASNVPILLYVGEGGKPSWPGRLSVVRRNLSRALRHVQDCRRRHPVSNVVRTLLV